MERRIQCSNRNLIPKGVHHGEADFHECQVPLHSGGSGNGCKNSVGGTRETQSATCLRGRHSDGGLLQMGSRRPPCWRWAKLLGGSGDGTAKEHGKRVTKVGGRFRACCKINTYSNARLIKYRCWRYIASISCSPRRGRPMVARGGAQAQPLETTVIKYLSGALEGRKNLSPFQGSELALSLSRGCAALRPWLPIGRRSAATPT